ncbi:MAG: ribonuclease III [Opitutales bacterium]
MNAALAQLQHRLDYRFRDPARLELALTHPSFLNESGAAKESNQRLEFLGDAVLQLILSEELFRLYPHEREGALTLRRKKLVEGRFTAGLAAELGLGHLLRVPATAAAVTRTQSALEDAFEALVAAIFLDAGYERTRQIVLGLYGDVAERLKIALPADNPKGQLQEKVQPLHGNNALRYDVVRTSGAAHAREFEVAVYFKDRLLGTGHGPSKKLAEEAAAQVALQTLEHAPLE